MPFRRRVGESTVQRRVNYVLCAWSGARRTPAAGAESDASYYLRTHLSALRKYRHELEQITIMVPRNPDEPDEFRELLCSLPQRIQGARVAFIERPNVGLSYGSFSDAYAMYRTQFDYYFFAEDDYVFVQHNFDLQHVLLMEQDEKCGYLCGLAWNANGSLPMHAGMANGLLRTSALEKVFLEHGEIPHAKNNDYRHAEASGQVGQSQAIIKQGYTLRDWSGRYQIGFRQPNGIERFHASPPEPMAMPIGWEEDEAKAKAEAEAAAARQRAAPIPGPGRHGRRR